MPVSEIDVDQLQSLDPLSLQLIDVREPDEFEDARVPGALLIPLVTVPGRLDDLDATKPLYVICASGGRSMSAAKYLSEQGHDAVNIAGGTKAWVASGKAFDTGVVNS